MPTTSDEANPAGPSTEKESGGFVDRPLFPQDLVPTAIRKRATRQFFDSEIRSEDDLEHLLDLLYRQPEVTTYSFHPKGQPANSRLIAAEQTGFLQLVETQGYWYEHPKYPNNFVRVSSQEPEFEWQRDLKQNGMVLYRNEWGLTTQEKRRREIEETADAIAAASDPRPQSFRQRVEHHYRDNQALYWVVAVMLGVIVTLAL